MRPDRPWLVIVWNDPINLMSYVTYVFQKLFGYSRDKATKLMLDVHHKGRAVVSSGPRERAELDVFRLHEHGLWATMEQVVVIGRRRFVRDRHGRIRPGLEAPERDLLRMLPQQARGARRPRRPHAPSASSPSPTPTTPPPSPTTAR